MPFSPILLPFIHLHKKNQRPTGYQIQTTPQFTDGETEAERDVCDCLRLHRHSPARLPLPAAFQHSTDPRALFLLVSPDFSLVIFTSLYSSPSSSSPYILTVTFRLKSSKYIRISEPQICIFNILLLNFWWFIYSKLIFINIFLYIEGRI